MLPFPLSLTPLSCVSLLLHLHVSSFPEVHCFIVCMFPKCPLHIAFESPRHSKLTANPASITGRCDRVETRNGVAFLLRDSGGRDVTYRAKVIASFAQQSGAACDSRGSP